MPTENDKRAAQTTFLSAENIKELYQQIASEGHVLAGGESLTQQITQDMFPEIELEIQREKDIEPER